MTLRSADDIPTESGLDDAAKKRMQGSRHSEWAEKHAIQILGCIHHHYRYLAELETTSTNDGSTTLLVLSSDLTSDIEETFTNDKGQNELELLVRESAIQPMIHPPLDWNKVEVDGKTQAQAKVSMQEAPLPNEPGFDEWEKAESEAAAKRKKDAARHPQAEGTEKAAEEEDWSETRFSGGYLSTLMRSRREII
jgi:hypothetical protein